MQPKIILGPAWAEKEGMLDSALASLFDINLSSILAATEDTRCPRCGNPPADSYARLLTNGPATATPEQVSGHVIVRCLCETVFAFAFVHEMNTQQPVGEAQVRAVSEVAEPAMPPGRHPTHDRGDEPPQIVFDPPMPVGRPMMSEDVVLRRRSGWHPAYDTWTSTSRLCGPLALITS